MDIDIKKAFKAPLCVDNWVLKVIIGGILIMIPFANFGVIGYLVKALKNFINKEERLPEYANWGELFVTGGKLIIGSILFAIPVFLLALITSMLFSKAGALSVVLNLVIEIVAGIIALIMVAGFAIDEKILSMVDFGRMKKFIENNNSGIVSLILGVLGVYLVYMLVSVVACLLVVTIVLLPFICYAMMISIYNVIGQFASNAPNLNQIKAEAGV